METGGVGIGELAALGTALLWTLSTLAWTSAGKHVGALAVSFVRLVITCGFLLAYGRLVRGLWLPSDASAENWLVLGASGVVGFFLADICLFKAFLLIGPRLTLLLQSLAPPFAAIFSWLLLDDPLVPKDWLAMLVTLAGVSWVVLERPDVPAEPHSRRQEGWGIFLAVVGALGQAGGLVLSKRGIGEYDAVAATFIRVLGAMIGYLILITAVRRWPAMLAASRHAQAMLMMTYGAFVGPFVGVALSLVAVRHCHAGVAATIINTMPVLILPIAVVVYKEKVSLRAAAGAVVSVAGVALLVL